MSHQSHPMVMIMAALERHEDFQAQAERDRLGRLAQQSSPRRWHWFNLPAIGANALMLALLLMRSHRV